MAQPSNSILRAAAYLAAVLVGIPIALGTLGYLLLPDSHGDGGCEGIGFGCTLAPNDAAGLIAGFTLFATVPAVAVSPVLMWVWARQSPAFRERSSVAKAVWVAVVYAVVGLLAFAFTLWANRPR